MKKFFKQLFCFHSNWMPYSRWHPLMGLGYHIHECKDCGKVIAREPWNPPINKDVK